jgi:hypothetical protein
MCFPGPLLFSFHEVIWKVGHHTLEYTRDLVIGMRKIIQHLALSVALHQLWSIVLGSLINVDKDK